MKDTQLKIYARGGSEGGGGGWGRDNLHIFVTGVCGWKVKPRYSYNGQIEKKTYIFI